MKRLDKLNEWNKLSDKEKSDKIVNDLDWEIKNDLDPTPEEWVELKKNLPKFIKEGIQFALIMGIMLMFIAFVIVQIIKLLHILL